MKSTPAIVTVIAALGMGACETTPPQQDAAIWNKPPRYGHGGTQDPNKDPNAVDGQEKKPRFGFGGDDASTAQAGGTAGNSNTAGTPPANNTSTGNLGSTPGANNTTADGKTADKKGNMAKTDGEGSKSSPPSNIKSYPFGKPVPGKGGFVTLPSPHDGLGEVDVRGIAPGTAVEIPDPTKPGKKIYFRVP